MKRNEYLLKKGWSKRWEFCNRIFQTSGCSRPVQVLFCFSSVIWILFENRIFHDFSRFLFCLFFTYLIHSEVLLIMWRLNCTIWYAVIFFFNKLRRRIRKLKNSNFNNSRFQRSNYCSCTYTVQIVFMQCLYLFANSIKLLMHADEGRKNSLFTINI